MDIALFAKKKMLRTKLILKKTFFIFIISSFFTSLASQGRINHAPTGFDYKSKLQFTKDCKKDHKQYFVKNVFDGDTILIAGEKKIRFLGIDAFEHDQLPCGKKAKDFLTKLVLNKNVCIETDIQENDVYRRTLGYVFLDGKLVNEELVKNGLAIIYDFPPNVKYISKLKSAQIYARNNMLGVWENQNYIKETPSQWRHKHPFKKNTRKVPHLK